MQNWTRPLTPTIDTGSVKAIVNIINSGTDPLYIPSKPIDQGPENECFPIVDNYIAQHGGSRVLGWTLWELPGIFIEAEFHAVWKSPEGEFVDLVPRKDKTVNILFLPDLNAIYDGYQVNNIRIPLTNNPAIRRFIQAFDKKFEFENRGDRKGQYGQVELSDADAEEYELLMMHIVHCEMQMKRLHKPLGPYDPCYCGSGKKLKWCHKK